MDLRWRLQHGHANKSDKLRGNKFGSKGNERFFWYRMVNKLSLNTSLLGDEDMSVAIHIIN